MAEDSNDILEEETNDSSPAEEPSERSENKEDKSEAKDKPVLFGLSKSLLIKIGIGVAVITLISGLAIFFLMGSDDTSEEASPMLLEDGDIASEPDATNSSPEDNAEDSLLPSIDTSMESDEEESVTLPTVVKKQTDENGNVIPMDNLIDPMGEMDKSMAQTAPPSESDLPAIDPASVDTSDIADSTKTAAATNDTSSPDKLLKEVMALQQQLSKQKSTNHELIKQIQQLSNENKSLKSEDLTASDYVAPATPSFTDNNETQSNADKPIQYQEYRYSQQHKLDIGPQWGDVKPKLAD